MSEQSVSPDADRMRDHAVALLSQAIGDNCLAGKIVDCILLAANSYTCDLLIKSHSPKAKA